jgi:alkylation response protein AidB-like acyl-CoA dehydrogenase
MDADTVYKYICAISADFANERSERQQRRELVAADFARLRDAGFLLTGVPVDHGGIWESVGASARPICEMLRTLAHGDSSVALVCAMHPAVLNFWMATGEAPTPFRTSLTLPIRRRTDFRQFWLATSRISSTNMSGSGSPAGTATVIM